MKSGSIQSHKIEFQANVNRERFIQKGRSLKIVIIDNVTVQCNERGEAVHLVLILNKLKKQNCMRAAAVLQAGG